MTYAIRPATLDDVAVLVHQRHAMFAEMGLTGDYNSMDREYARWLQPAMRHKVYFGWVAESESGEIVAGGGLAVLPWPPGPVDPGHQRAFIFNVYTEPAHRRQGLARQLMETMHCWCQEQGLKTVVLHASEFGRPLYESLGYQPTNEMLLEF
ncbi:MAG: GNAT family N-acetyltransferase [Chloroflexota bacterium]